MSDPEEPEEEPRSRANAPASEEEDEEVVGRVLGERRWNPLPPRGSPCFPAVEDRSAGVGRQG